MRVRWLGVALSVVVAASVPAVALGHGHRAAFSTNAEHLAEDGVSHDSATESRLMRRTRAATAADARVAAAAVAGNEHEVGSWGPVVDWPVVGIHEALLPNGKVLAWDSVGDHAAESYTEHNFTRAIVWDPATGTQTPVWVGTGYNVFCAGFAHLTDGSVFLAGGNKNAQLEGIVQTHVFNYLTNTWSLGPDMAGGRWYPTVTPLRTGEMLISDTVPELRMTNGSLRSLNEAPLSGLPLYPWLDQAPDGRTFYSGPDETMRMLDTNGSGAWQSFGQRDSLYRDYGSHALYDIGKMLVAGGANSSKDARVIDINGATPQVAATAPMANGRRQHNVTVLADGTVLATGGNSSGSSLVDLDNGVYVAELWNPATGTWKTLAAEQVTRQYHSTALLLADGRVLSSGGGVCGTCDGVGYLGKNAQVFTPPYLFKADGSGELAPRPTIAAAPASVAYGAGFQVDTPDAAAIRKAALVRLGAVTHSVNFDQRYVPLTFTAGPGALEATAPANANIAPPGVYMLFIIDASGVPSVAKMVSVGAPPPDASPPAAPSGLTASPVGSGRVDLSWTAAIDDVGVAGYRVERCAGPACTNFAEVGAPTPRAYSDPGLSASTTYRYRVRATDGGGNLGAYSNVVAATTGAAQPPPTGLVGAWAFGEGTGTTTADASGNGNGGTITGATWSTQGRYGNALSFNDSGDLVRVASSPSLNLGSAMTLSAWVQPADNQSGWNTILHRQSESYFLTASGDQALRPAGGGTLGGNVQSVSSPTAIPFNGWTHVALTYDGGTLRLYVNGAQVATRAAAGAVQSSTNPLWMGGNQPYGEYFQGLIDEVRVYNRALSPADVQTDMNTPVVPTAPDTTAPSAPTGPSAAAMSDNQINLSWSASSDDVGVLDYRLERCQGAGCTNFAQVAAPAATWFDDTGLAPSSTHRYRLRAVDQSGNASGYSVITAATTSGAADTTPPSAPTGLAATVVSSSRIDLAWSASTDNVGVTEYRVERCQGAGCTNFAQVGTPTTTDFSNTGLAASTTYRFRVRAVDATDNLSAYSALVAATTSGAGDSTPPSAPTGLAATVVSSSRIDLAWSASTDNVGVTGYQVQRCRGANCTNFAQIGTPTTTGFSSTGLAANTTYRFRVRAVDAAANLSPYSAIVSGRTLAADTTAPTTPTGVVATPASSTQINLGWTASTDNVGVTGYRVERCQGAGCTTFAQIATPATAGHSDTGLLPGTTYRYRVRAVDAAGNLSSYSTIASATTPAIPDNSPPSAPSGLSAVAIGSGQVDLSWSAATDDVGVVSYRVERCSGQACTTFAEVASPTATSYSNTGLSASTTYRYRVRAADAADNLSGYSDVAEGTTDAAPPTPPGLVGAWAFGEGTGTTTADASGNGNVGTITAATWSTQGRYGNALSFNGTNSVVRVASSPSLNLGSAMTLSAWIQPTASLSGWRAIVQRQVDAYFLHASSDSPLRPAGGGEFGGNVQYLGGPTAIPFNAWTHVAVSYDGAALRLYVNGTQVATRVAGGAIQSSTNPLWIGGNQPYGEYFQGLIDEVRVYNRALSAADVQTDMNAPLDAVTALGGLAGLRQPSLLL